MNQNEMFGKHLMKVTMLKALTITSLGRRVSSGNVYVSMRRIIEDCISCIVNVLHRTTVVVVMHTTCMCSDYIMNEERRDVCKYHNTHTQVESLFHIRTYTHS